MAYRILQEIIAGRDVNSLKCSEAISLVRDFYLRWEILTFSNPNQQKMDYLASQALKRAGLGCFA